MCVGGLHPGCRELLASELHARPHRAGQAEVFLDADQASAAPVVEAVAVSLTTGGRRSVDDGAYAYTASGALDACAYSDGDGDPGASRARAYAIKGRAARWS